MKNDLQKFFIQFLKWFFITLFAQVLFLIFFLYLIPTFLGEIFAIVFYLTPWMFVLKETGEKKELTNFLITIGIGLPATIYSIVLSLLIIGLRKAFVK